MPHNPREISRRLVDWPSSWGKFRRKGAENRAKTWPKVLQGWLFHRSEEARALRISQSRLEAQ